MQATAVLAVGCSLARTIDGEVSAIGPAATGTGVVGLLDNGWMLSLGCLPPYCQQQGSCQGSGTHAPYKVRCGPSGWPPHAPVCAPCSQMAAPTRSCKHCRPHYWRTLQGSCCCGGGRRGADAAAVATGWGTSAPRTTLSWQHPVVPVTEGSFTAEAKAGDRGGKDKQRKGGGNTRQIAK